MKNITLLAIVSLLIFSLSAGTVFAGFEEDYQKVATIESYKAYGDKETAQLIQNTSSVLHRENTKIISELEKIKSELKELKKLILKCKNIK